jgi:signal peptidase I
MPVASVEPAAERRWTVRRVLRAAAAVLVGALLLTVGIGFVTSERVSGASMRPTLRSGDRVLIDTSAYHKAAPRRFDVVALHAPGAAAVTVPADRYFVLGDNPAASRDSRAFGFVPRSRIVGRVSVRVWPPGSVRGEPRLVPVAG